MVTRFLKRTMDIFGALVGIILSLPLLAVVPILIKLDSPGPVFYSQTRVGRNRRKADRRYHQRSEVDDRRKSDRRKHNLHGRPFRLLKFRTMVRDAEKASGPVWASKDDTRVTRLGRILRKTRIDEVPQFFNVLVGDMALVGPRPERPTFVQELSTRVEGYTDRLQVKPGITGLAQVEGGYDTAVSSVVEKVGYDVAYIRSMSVWNDLKILGKTVRVVLTGKGAH
jgi:lipopolysaccharide/colanic/teichoic acid biosynthesis glycosyltransferase